MPNTGYPYPMEMYKGNVYRVVHGPEEHESMKAKGWSEEPEDGVNYIPITAAPPEEPSNRRTARIAPAPAPPKAKEPSEPVGSGKK